MEVLCAAINWVLTRIALGKIPDQYPYAVVTRWSDNKITATGVESVPAGMEICEENVEKNGAEEAWIWERPPER